MIQQQTNNMTSAGHGREGCTSGTPVSNNPRTEEGNMTITTAAQALRVHVLDSLSYLNDLLFELEGQGVLTRADVVAIQTEASASVRAGLGDDRATDRQARPHTVQPPANSLGSSGPGFTTEETPDDRADVRDAQSNEARFKAARKEYAQVMLVVDRNMPTVSAVIRRYIHELSAQSATARIEARDLRARLDRGDV